MINNIDKQQAADLIKDLNEVADLLKDNNDQNGGGGGGNGQGQGKGKGGGGKGNGPTKVKRGSGSGNSQSDIKKDLDKLSKALDKLNNKLNKKGGQKGGNGGNGGENGGDSGGERRHNERDNSWGYGPGGGDLDISEEAVQDVLDNIPVGQKLKELQEMTNKAIQDSYRGGYGNNATENDLRIAPDEEQMSAEEIENITKAMYEQSINNYNSEHNDCEGMKRVFKMAYSYYPLWFNILKTYLLPDRSQNSNYFQPQRNPLYGVMGGGRKICLTSHTKEKKKLKNLLIAIDTSGSIDDKQLAAFIGQVNKFLDERKRTVSGRVCYWGSEVVAEGEFHNIDEFQKIQPKDGGGTEVECALDYGIAHKSQYLVIYTDGGFSMPSPKYANFFRKVIWVLWDRTFWEEFIPPFGVKTL